VERAIIVSKDGMLEASSLSGVTATPAQPETVTDGTLEEVDRAHILRVLDGTAWRIEGDGGAARKLGLHPSTLRGRMRKLGIHKAS
jgi:transcriptional regulator with GAF, ATPase, and Fis domain